MACKVISSPKRDVFGQMALDEALVLSLPPNTASIRFFNWNVRPQATFGYVQNAQSALSEISAQDIKNCTRRITGGGIVLHTDDLTFSLIFDLPSRISPSVIYGPLHNSIRQALLGLGLKAVAYTGKSDYKPTSKGISQSCFKNPVGDDLMQGESKILGGAIRRFDKRVLYQGSLQLGTLSETKDVKQAVVNGFLDYVKQDCIEDVVISSDILAVANKLAVEKYSTEKWIHKF